MDELRKKLIDYRNTFGTPYTVIAKSIGVTGGYLRTFVCGNSNRLGEDTAAKLICYLNERGF